MGGNPSVHSETVCFGLSVVTDQLILPEPVHQLGTHLPTWLISSAVTPLCHDRYHGTPSPTQKQNTGCLNGLTQLEKWDANVENKRIFTGISSSTRIIGVHSSIPSVANLQAPASFPVSFLQYQQAQLSVHTPCPVKQQRNNTRRG